MPTPFETLRTETETTLKINGSLDINTAPALAEEIDKIVATNRLGRGRHRVTGPDRQLRCRRAGQALQGDPRDGGVVAIRGARDQPLAIFKLLRMDKVFNL